MKRLTFMWPQEPYLPTSLFKHYVYLGETASYARRFGDVRIVDLSVIPSTKKEVLKVFKESDFVFVPVETYTARNSVELTNLARLSGNTTLVAYGSLGAMNPKVLAPYFDVVLANGNWERAIERLVKNDDFWDNVENKVYNKSERLDSDDWPYTPLDLLPIEMYDKLSPGMLEICVQKGCLFNCSFCAEKCLFPYKGIDHRSPENLAQFLIDNPGLTYYIDATTFSQDKEWAIEVCKRFTAINPLPEWRTVTRIDKIDEEIAEYMARAGCTKVGMGIETLSPDLQKSIRKPITEERIQETINILQSVGIIPRAFLILGLPGQTGEDVRYTQNFIENTGIEFRWKEYIPLEDAFLLTDIDDFKKFERNTYSMYPIPDLSVEEYLELLGTKR